MKETGRQKLRIWTPRGHWPRKGYGDVWPWRPPFHASPAVCKGPISSKRVSSQDPLLRKFGNFSLYNLNFRPNFSYQAPKFGNFQFTSPLFRGKYQFASPTLQKSGRTSLPEKKLSAPPRLNKKWLLLHIDKNADTTFFHSNEGIVWGKTWNTIPLFHLCCSFHIITIRLDSFWECQSILSTTE